MRKNKKIVVIIITIVITLIIGGIIFAKITKKEVIDTSSKNTTKDIDMSINTDDDDEKIDWSKYQETSYDLTKSISITEGGIYNLTGTISNGLITINTTNDVKLVLDNVSITNKTGPAIYIEEAADVIIETKENSKNYLEDGKTYSGYDAEVVGTIYSADDITFQGSGTLEMKSNYDDAVVGKDDLKIASGTYIINSKGDGIRGKDSVYIQDGTFTINSSGDGIKSTNDTDTEKGYILIEKGIYNITSELDALQAQTKLSIQGGTYNLKTGGGSTNSSTNDDWGRWGTSTQSNTTSSAKGLKAGDNLLISNATINFDTSDDAIHCNSYVGIKNGTLNISSGDDGVHADKELIIDDGTIKITKSYEGLEASKITINGGNINLSATDDGINIAGGNDSSAQNRPGANNYSSNEDNILTINNGTIYVNATGDGIDVNGSAYINGGTITVDGPTNNGNGALDYDRYFIVNGGVFLAGGSSGMLQGISSSSTQYNATIVFTTTYKGNDQIIITDSSGNEIITYKSDKSYNSLVISSPKLKKGETYTIKVNGSTYQTFKVSSITTTVGNTYGGQAGNPGQPPKKPR